MRLALDRLRAQAADCPTTAADLRGQDDLVAVATRGEPASDDRLGLAVLDEVGVRGVDEVAAGGGVGVEDRVGLGLVGGPAEHVGAEAEGEDVEVGSSEDGHVPHATHADPPACSGSVRLTPPAPPGQPPRRGSAALGQSRPMHSLRSDAAIRPAAAPEIVVRPACRYADAAGLDRLAARAGGRALHGGHVLVAEWAGRIVAAVSTHDGRAVADRSADALDAV